VDKDLNIIPGKFTSCRETFCAWTRYKHNSMRPGEGFSKINTDRLYVLISFGKPRSDKEYWYILRKMTKSLKIVNSFERHYKWPLSKIRRVDDKRKSITPSILFIGNRKWGISPYLVSFYILLLRLGKYQWVTDNIVNETDHKKLIVKLKKICSVNKHDSRDAMHIHTSISMANILMHNYDELFKGKPKKYHWNTDKLNGNSGSTEGIRLLAEGKTCYKALYKRCKKLQG